MNEQIAHCDVSVTQIGAEKRLTKEVDKLITGWMTAEELSSLMPRAVERAVALFNVIDQGAEERWTKLGFVLQCSRFQLASIKIVAGV
jgi:hypothetical protein